MENIYVRELQIFKDSITLTTKMLAKFAAKHVAKVLVFDINELMHQNAESRSEYQFKCIVYNVVVDRIEYYDYFLNWSYRWCKDAHILRGLQRILWRKSNEIEISLKYVNFSSNFFNLRVIKILCCS